MRSVVASLFCLLLACGSYVSPYHYSGEGTYVSYGVRRMVKSAARLRVYCDGTISAYGSATAISPRLALTARHMGRVCKGTSTATYTLQFDDGSIYEVAMLKMAKNEEVDTAQLYDVESITFAHYARVAAYEPARGQHVWVYAGDGKLDVPGEWGFVIKEGRVSRVLDGVLVVSAHGVPGNSGCGVFDDAGRLLAVLWGGSWNPNSEFYFEAYRPAAWPDLLQ